MSRRFRLVTRSDFDGLVCAVLFKALDLVEGITFVHPKDMQDRGIMIGGGDITTNLPYVEGVHVGFDHHLSETLRVAEPHDNHIIDAKAPSAARVVYDHYGGKEAFPGIPENLMDAVDRADSGHITADEKRDSTIRH